VQFTSPKNHVRKEAKAVVIAHTITHKEMERSVSCILAVESKQESTPLVRVNYRL
jgi:hypothetical protein